MNPKSSLILRSVQSETWVSSLCFATSSMQNSSDWNLSSVQKEVKLVHLFIPSSLLHLQAYLWKAGYNTCSFTRCNLFFCQRNCPSWASCNLLCPMHVRTYSTACEPGAPHIWETSDLLRLICTCTKSPVYPERTTFTGTYHLCNVQLIPGFITAGFTGHILCLNS